MAFAGDEPVRWRVVHATTSLMVAAVRTRPQAAISPKAQLSAGWACCLFHSSARITAHHPPALKRPHANEARPATILVTVAAEGGTGTRHRHRARRYRTP